MSKLANPLLKIQVLRDAQNSTLGVVELAKRYDIPHNTLSDFLNKKTWKSWWKEVDRGEFDLNVDLPEQHRGAKILTLDIETAPCKGAFWRLFKQNISLSMIDKDWYVLSWAAKWLHEDRMYYEDKKDSYDTEDDSVLLQNIWDLLNEADIIITQNGKRFDVRKLNARFILNGMKPPSPFRHVDVCEEAKRHFGFTSNKLEYMTEKLCKKYKKLKHQSFPGYVLWDECLKGSTEAWQEMQDYNIRDVLSLEELYIIVRPWMKTHPNLNVYFDDEEVRCTCGSTDFEEDGFAYTNLAKYTKFRCNNCGASVRDRVNLLPKTKRKSLRANIL